MGDEAARYERIAGEFDRRVRAVAPDAWDRPAPCDGWVARDVVGHLVEWVPGFLSSQAGLESPPLPSAADDPVKAWAALDAQLRGWFEDPAVAEQTFDGPMGPTTIEAAIDQFITTDVLLHTWDLAKATGQDDRLDPVELEGLLEGMEPADAALRASGHYGPRVEVPVDAPYQDRLLAFIGRDPAWSPSS